MFEAFINYFDGKKFDTLDEYREEVHRFSDEVEENLGRAERWALSGDEDILDQLGVTIKELEDDPDGSE